jgi:hypothetical protein
MAMSSRVAFPGREGLDVQAGRVVLVADDIGIVDAIRDVDDAGLVLGYPLSLSCHLAQICANPMFSIPPGWTTSR